MGFEPQPLNALYHALKMPHGMILLTGPTGSGKNDYTLQLFDPS
jgi:type IV pilus assembly protein PilB